jgi:hypothetical protein
MADATIKLKEKIDEFEADGTQVIGIHLTPEMTKAIRWELHLMYGKDPGDDLVLLFGAAVLSQDADELRFET